MDYLKLLCQTRKKNPLVNKGLGDKTVIGWVFKLKVSYCDHWKSFVHGTSSSNMCARVLLKLSNELGEKR